MKMVFENFTAFELVAALIFVGLPCFSILLAFCAGCYAKLLDFFSDSIVGKESTKFDNK